MTAPENTEPTRRTQPRLSPEAVRAHTFARASLRRRGVDEEEVRAFIGRVAEELASADAEKAGLRAEIERLRDRFREHNRAEDSMDRPSAEAINVLSAAQQQADNYVAQAQDYCREVTNQARHQADEIMQEAHDRAEHAANEAARAYRAPSGAGYSAELEDMERRVAWIQSYCRTVQVQMQAASDAFSREIGRLGDLTSPEPPPASPTTEREPQRSQQRE